MADDTAQRLEVQAQEINRLRAQLKEQARTASQDAATEMRVRFRYAIGGLTLAALVIGGLIGRFGFPAPASGPTPATQIPVMEEKDDGDAGLDPVPTPWPLRVHVAGAVAAPQVVNLPPGSLVLDAIAAAGGETVDADLEAINLAAPVADGQRLVVPQVGASRTPTADPDSEGASAGIININTASSEELATLPYIGETKAAAIVAYREEYGAFTHIEEIQEVPGIGPAIFEHIATLITVEP